MTAVKGQENTRVMVINAFHRQSWWLRLGSGGLCALILGCGACGSGLTLAPPPSASTPVNPDASAQSSRSMTATPSGSPTPSDETLALQACRRYYDAFTQAIAARDTTRLRTTFTSGCRVCMDDAALIDDARAAGRTFAGGQFTVTDPWVTSRPEATRILVRATVSDTAISVTDAAGTVVQRSEAGTGPKDFVVHLTRLGWLVEGVSRG